MGVEGRVYASMMQEAAKLERQLTADLSKAIGQVLKEYGIDGGYSFQVLRGEGEEQVQRLKGAILPSSMRLDCLGAGYAKVENPDKVE